MVSLSSLNAQLAYIQGSLNYETLLGQVTSAQQTLVAEFTSKLGTEINQILGGFQSITQETDNQTPSTFGDNVPGGIAMLVENPPGLEIQKPVSGINSDLELLTEDTVGGGFLNIDVTLGTPKAVGTALSRITGQPASTTQPAVREVSPEMSGVSDKISAVLSNIQNGIASASTLISSVESFIGTMSGRVTGEVLGALQDLPSALSSETIPLNSPVVNINSTNERDVVRQDATFVSSQLEVQAILSAIQREVTELVVGTTQTFKNEDARASNSTSWHFIITRDGEIQQSTPINTVGDYAVDHTTNSIGIAFAGGLNTTSGESVGDPSLYASSASITRNQWNSFDKFLGMFYAVFPYGQVIGTSDIPTMQETSPGFDVKDYVRQRFGKVTIVDTSKPAPTLPELQGQMATASQKALDPKIQDEPEEI